MRRVVLALTATMVAMSFMACNNQEETTPNNQIGRDALPEYFHITSSDTQLRAEKVDTGYFLEPVSVEEIGLTEEGSKVEFDGILDSVIMNDNHKKKSEGKHVQELSLTRGSNANEIDFYLHLDSIGKMPGYLEIDAKKGVIDPKTGLIQKTFFRKSLHIKKHTFFGDATLGSFNVTIEGRIGKAYDKKTKQFLGYVLEVKILSDGKLLGFINVMKAHVETHGFKK